MTFACPYCNLESEGDVFPGQMAECPYCGERFEIPSGPEARIHASVPDSSGSDDDSPIVITPIRSGDGSDPLPPSASKSASTPHPNEPLRIQRGTIEAIRADQNGSHHRRKRWPIAVASIAAILVIAGVGAWVGGAFDSGSKEDRDLPYAPPQVPATTRPPTATRPIPPTTTRAPRVFTGPRAHVKRYIDSHGDTCRVVSLTKRGGDVVVCNRNDWASSGCPQALNEVLDRIANQGGRITDVTITENGRWLVLYDRNAGEWSYGLPADMVQALRQYNRNNEEIRSATFNDSGDWIIVTDEHYHSSASYLTDWLSDGQNRYGSLLAACVSEDQAVAVYEQGYKFLNVPESLKSALRETSIDVRIIKLAGPAWFFASAYGSYQYNM